MKCSLFTIEETRKLNAEEKAKVLAAVWGTASNTEEKAKVLAAVWGTEFIQILCRASYFAKDDFEEYVGEIHPFLSSWCILIQFFYSKK